MRGAPLQPPRPGGSHVLRQRCLSPVMQGPLRGRVTRLKQGHVFRTGAGRGRGLVAVETRAWSCSQIVRLVTWLDGSGRAVSMAAVRTSDAGMARLGPVWTPVGDRRHGRGVPPRRRRKRFRVVTPERATPTARCAVRGTRRPRNCRRDRRSPRPPRTRSVRFGPSRGGRRALGRNVSACAPRIGAHLHGCTSAPASTNPRCQTGLACISAVPRRRCPRRVADGRRFRVEAHASVRTTSTRDCSSPTLPANTTNGIARAGPSCGSHSDTIPGSIGPATIA